MTLWFVTPGTPIWIIQEITRHPGRLRREKGDDMKPEEYANISAVLGITLGSLVWAILAGFAVKDPALAALAAALCAVIITGAILFLSRYPERRLSIFGWMITVVIAADFFFLNRCYSNIPSSFYGVSTGKECVSLCSLNWLLVLFALAGVLLVVFDIVLMRKNNKPK